MGLVSTQLKNITSNGTILATEDIALSVDIITNIVNNVPTIDQEVTIDCCTIYLNAEWKKCLSNRHIGKWQSPKVCEKINVLY